MAIWKSPRLDEKPPGRKPVETRLIPIDKSDDMIDGVARQIETGARLLGLPAGGRK